MLTIASEGGVISAIDLTKEGILGLMDKADKKRLLNALPNYEEVAKFLEGKETFKPMRKMDDTEALEFKEYMELRMKHMAQISAAMQKANIIDEERKARAENKTEGTPAIDAYTSEARSLWINFIQQEN